MTKRLTQKQRLLEHLRDKGEQGAYVYEFMMPRPNGLGIAQYNARIKELRTEGYTIINTKPGHFVLKEEKNFLTNEKGQYSLL